MIAVSDAVLILASAAALGSGLYRWHNNLEQAQPVSSRPAVSAQVTNTANIQTQNINASTTSDNSVLVENSPQPDIVNTDNTDVNTTNIAQTSTAAQPTADAVALGSYVVQSGDTLSKIAVDFGTTVSFLQEINELESTVINIGQVLDYPLSAN